jgi:hypothetical protein
MNSDPVKQEDYFIMRECYVSFAKKGVCVFCTEKKQQQMLEFARDIELG